MINIGLIFGSKSVEHEISILTYFEVLNELSGDYNIIPIYITKNLDMYVINSDLNEFKDLNLVTKKSSKCNIVKNGIRVLHNFVKLDCAIILAHGSYGEDGMLASLLDMNDIAYVGSNHIKSGIMQDKEIMKVLLKDKGFNVIPYNNTFPMIVKPSMLGSSIGISVCNSELELNDAVNKALLYGPSYIVEDYISDSIEFNCAVLKNKDEMIVSNIDMITNKHDILTYNDKYESKRPKRDINPAIDDKLKNEIINTSKKIYEVFKLKGVVRIDYIYNGNLYVNEVNTIPGSLAYYLFDIPIMDILVKNAIMDKANNKYIYDYEKNVLSLNSKGK